MNKNRIYIFWWQGIETAPDIVKVCYQSLLLNYNNETQEIVLLNKDNIFDFINFPDYIIKKFKENTITITHLSDIARTLLLGNTGGLWVDATMFFTKKIDDEIFQKDFFTLKNPSVNDDNITSKWECFFIAGKKDFPLFGLLKDMWFEYWKKEDMLIDYLLTDHIFYIGYRENERIRKALDQSASFYYRIDYFQQIINQEYDESKYQEICKNEPYLKLTYKGNLEELTPDGKLTYYGKLLRDYLK